jgi:phosphoribosylformylglycinamidine (FGAM) synthase-like enzyme
LQLQLIARPNIASKKWIYQQYDSMVGIGNTSTNVPSDAAVVRINGTDTALALKVDCNARYLFSDPMKGAMIAVSEACEKYCLFRWNTCGHHQLPEFRKSIQPRGILAVCKCDQREWEKPAGNSIRLLQVET